MSEINKKLGVLLKAERERQNISLEDLAEKLKLSEANLRAIEDGDASALPSELYFSLFSKTYSEAIGIDYSRTIDAIKDDLNEIESSIDNGDEKVNNKKKKSTEESSDETSQKELIKKVGYFFGAIVVLFILFITVNKIFFNSEDSLSKEPTQTNDIETTEQNSAELEAAYTNYNWDNPDYQKPEKLKLTLTPREDSWATIFADGDTAKYQTLRAGRVYQVEADYRLLVSIGIPSVVTVKLNGKEVDLRNPESRRISRVLINQMNINSFLNPTKREVDSPPLKATTVTSKVTAELEKIDNIETDTIDSKTEEQVNE